MFEKTEKWSGEEGKKIFPFSEDYRQFLSKVKTERICKRGDCLSGKERFSCGGNF